ncbi:MAG: hypothetical protein JXP34_26090 [Planctomycetes bacterium]|nr:hypothetical protein [Planctomycetota bacterium]
MLPSSIASRIAGMALAVAGGILGVTSRIPAAEEIRREDLGRKEKLRILVDKVMQPEEDWVTREWMVRETAEAGFNVFSPRRGHERLDEVAQVNRWCRRWGIFHMPWMRGTLGAPDAPAAAGKRVLWANGSEQPIWSACSDEFWEWAARYILEYAKLASEDDRLIGVFLDYENYWPGGGGNLYDITYEDAILLPFVASRGIERPELPPAGRKDWLEARDLHDAFVAFQIDHWRKRCRDLRRRIDAIFPGFRFCIYPAPGTRFMVEACYPEWATEKAPLILADASVYGRPSRFLPQAEALLENRRRLEERTKVPREAGIPFLYAGGIDPVVQGADPEFCGNNAVMICESTDGYWVFYEGPKYRLDHPEYFRWFSWANERIRRGDLAAWKGPRTTPETRVLDVFKGAAGTIAAKAPEVTGTSVKLDGPTLRGENILLLAVRKGRRAEVVLRNVPVARYVSLLAWEVRRQDLTRIASGTIEHGKEGAVVFEPQEDGIYLLGASSGSCGYSVSRANVPVGLYAAGRGLGVIRAADKLLFRVPEGLGRFRIRARSSGLETVRMTVSGPDGRAVATAQTSPSRSEVDLDVEVRAGQAGVWTLSTGKADEGVIEDYTLLLSGSLAPVFALVEGHVFGK